MALEGNVHFWNFPQGYGAELQQWRVPGREHGRPQFTFGHTLNKTLARAGLPTDFEEWSAMAQDRAAWRARIYSLAEYPTPPPARGAAP